MKWNILHESRGRIRLHRLLQLRSLAEAALPQDIQTILPG